MQARTYIIYLEKKKKKKKHDHDDYKSIINSKLTLINEGY